MSIGSAHVAHASDSSETLRHPGHFSSRTITKAFHKVGAAPGTHNLWLSWKYAAR